MEELFSNPQEESRRLSPGVHRRKPAHESVSLRHHTSKSPSPSRNSEDGSSMQDHASNRPSMPPSQPSYQKESSGESSNPEKWFEKSNNNPKTKNSFEDDEPPFFLRRTSSESTPTDVFQQRALAAQSNRIESRRDNVLGSPDGGSSEDFRSVIDDLTIENRRLKRKLRRFENIHRGHMSEQKLLEVRVHRLSNVKKRELEELLKDFVTKVDSSKPQSQSHMVSGASHIPSSLQPGLTGSSNRSTGVDDSGYGSLGTSIRNSSSMSNSPSMTQRGQISRGMSNQQKQDIHTYLHDIPPSLLPNTSGPLTEKEKRKAVVQRLEYVFAGRDSSHNGHRQPIQQQKVSQSAARADRREAVNRGEEAGVEGSREARIMPKMVESFTAQVLNPTLATKYEGMQSPADKLRVTDDVMDPVYAQRPTR